MNKNCGFLRTHISPQFFKGQIEGVDYIQAIDYRPALSGAIVITSAVSMSQWGYEAAIIDIEVINLE